MLKLGAGVVGQVSGVVRPTFVQRRSVVVPRLRVTRPGWRLRGGVVVVGRLVASASLRGLGWWPVPLRSRSSVALCCVRLSGLESHGSLWSRTRSLTSSCSRRPTATPLIAAGVVAGAAELRRWADITAMLEKE